MILQSLYDFAQNQNILSQENRAFKNRSLDYLIDLDDQGQPIGVIPLKSTDSTYKCPVSLRNKSAGGVADFLVGRTTALFGLDLTGKKLSAAQKARRDENNREKFEDFWQQIADAHQDTQSPLLASLLAFQPEFAALPEFIRYGHKQSATSSGPPSSGPQGWWIRIADGSEKKLTDAESFTFSVQQKLLILDQELIRPY